MSYEDILENVYLYINPIRLSPLNEGRPQPVVDIWVANVANNVAPPVDPLVKVGETFLNPACNEKRLSPDALCHLIWG